MPYRSVEELDELWRRVGLSEVKTDHLRVETSYTGFDDLWEPFTFGVGPAGAYLAKLSPEQREQLRTELFKRVGEPSGPFTLSATACAVRGSAKPTAAVEGQHRRAQWSPAPDAGDVCLAWPW